ncbi:curli-like amyloid fiber formation chaperone CsgH [Beijerinckia sp. L45]|uniref:curli-like amyloid fiber formation chaperone CsgH n=1 Tax=Beijerinckia sp. L45 TaxID=1641855 RepID=UPI00131BA2BC|nr:curli-like amyloid fiber formation chaperone CsgH [Beijerinckia sp. L45]
MPDTKPFLRRAFFWWRPFVVGCRLAAMLAGVASPTQAFADAEPECQIHASLGENGLSLEAIVVSKAPLSGDYKLMTSKESGSGSSQNIQSGVFQLAAGGRKTLATIVLDTSAVDHYQATLLLNWDGGRKTCKSP